MMSVVTCLSNYSPFFFSKEGAMFIQSWGVIFTRKDFFVKNVLLLSLASFSIRLALRLGLCFVEGMWVIKKGKQEYRLSFFS